MDERACCKICVHEAKPTLSLFVTDSHEGLLAAVSDLFSATPRQRCLVHKQRNVLNAIPRRERGDVQAELVMPYRLLCTKVQLKTPLCTQQLELAFPRLLMSMCSHVGLRKRAV